MLRHEFKYHIHSADAKLLELRLAQVMQSDRYATADGSYRVSSLYFDTPTASAFYDKLDGLDHRAKYRIRYYNDNLDYLRLEKKEKIGISCRKRAARVSAAEAELLASPRFEAHEPAVPLEREFLFLRKNEALRPYFFVDYRRRAFCYPFGNVRITLDSSLSATRFAESFSERGAAGILRVLEPEVTVLEVKYDAFLPPHLSALLEDVPKTQLSVSKYCLCFEALLKEYV